MNRRVGHLARRAIGSLSNAKVNATDIERVRNVLLPQEMTLWLQQQPRDQRHSAAVWDRFVDIYKDPSLDEQRACLLHDLGKCQSNVGWCGRVLATLLGGRTDNLRKYLKHEQLGVQLLQGISSPRTIEILSGTANDSASLAIIEADNF